MVVAEEIGRRRVPHDAVTWYLELPRDHVHQVGEECEALICVAQRSGIRKWQAGVKRSDAWIRLHHAVFIGVCQLQLYLVAALRIQNALLVLSRVASKSRSGNYVDVIRPR